jgi:hypothetical protein
VIVPTGGKRMSLIETLSSIFPQLESGDEIILTRLDCPWGHRARDLAMPRAAGTHLMFCDDDDVYVPNALQLVREQVLTEPDRVHLFAMRLGQTVYEVTDGNVTIGRVGTPMIVVPNVPGKLGSWGESEYEGDWNFLSSTLRIRGDEPIAHPDVIALIKP